jgi:hypothetical protein
VSDIFERSLERLYHERMSEVGPESLGGEQRRDNPAISTTVSAGIAPEAPPPSPTKPRCSFCGKSKDSHVQLVGGPGTVAICHECVGACFGLLWPMAERVTGWTWGKGIRSFTDDRAYLRHIRKELLRPATLVVHDASQHPASPPEQQTDASHTDEA